MTGPVSESREASRTPTGRNAARGPYPKGDRRKDQILEKAFEVFATGGYRTASVVQIAAACGVTRAGLLHHFPTKEALLEAVLSERDRRAAELFFTGTPAEEDDGLAYFARLIKVADHNTRNPGIVSLYAVLSTEATDPAHPAHAYFVARYQRSLERTRLPNEPRWPTGSERDSWSSSTPISAEHSHRTRDQMRRDESHD
jgi:AcrR family transcriptional regulator